MLTAQKESSSYLERTDKYFLSSKTRVFDDIVSWIEEKGFEKIARGLICCEKKYIELSDENSHRFLKRCFCGREFCPVCGASDPRKKRGGFVNKKPKSPVHRQRYARLWRRLMPFRVLGKVELTVPKHLREKFKNIEMLKALHRRGWAVVREVFGAEGAMTNVHFFGDQSDEFHPHVNVLFPTTERRISKRKLKCLQCLWKLQLYDLCGEFPDVVVVHYSFRDSIIKKAHTLRYVTRPTVGFERFAFGLDEEMRLFLLSLRRFHNFRWFGILSNSTHKSYNGEKFEMLSDEEIERNLDHDQIVVDKLEKRGCPVCGEKLKYMARRDGEIVKEEIKRREWLPVADEESWYCDFDTWLILKNLTKEWGRNDYKRSE